MVGDGVASMFAAEARRSQKLGNTKTARGRSLCPQDGGEIKPKVGD